MTSLRILHLASFSGNIGDNANHLGFRGWLQEQTIRPIIWTELEIREFFWRERLWNIDLVDYINKFDAMIVGGGNYFELWVDDSPTGTSIAIEPGLWQKIHVPVFFNALGVDVGQGAPQSCIERFRTFLDLLLCDEKVLVTIRNDGSMIALKSTLGEMYADALLSAPDNGFFFEVPRLGSSENYFQGREVERILALNLACDMPTFRFSGFPAGFDDFATEFSHVVETLAELDPSLGFLFVPHMFSDLSAISHVISGLSSKIQRTRVAQASFGSGYGAAVAAFRSYTAANVCAGMRFHSNVVPIGNQKETIGLACYPQIPRLYEQVGQPDRAVDVSVNGFGRSLIEKIRAALEDPNAAFKGTPREALQSARNLRVAIQPRVSSWLEKV